MKVFNYKTIISKFELFQMCFFLLPLVLSAHSFQKGLLLQMFTGLEAIEMRTFLGALRKLMLKGLVYH